MFPGGGFLFGGVSPRRVVQPQASVVGISQRRDVAFWRAAVRLTRSLFGWCAGRTRRTALPGKRSPTPIGSSAGDITVRAARSASTMNAPPNSTASGRSARWPLPNTSRTVWGTMMPTKPSQPAHRDRCCAVPSDAASTTIMRTLLRFQSQGCCFFVSDGEHVQRSAVAQHDSNSQQEVRQHQRCLRPSRGGDAPPISRRRLCGKPRCWHCST